MKEGLKMTLDMESQKQLSRKKRNVFKIVIIVIIALIILGAITSYLVYRAFKSRSTDKIDELKNEFAAKINPAKEKLQKLCPPGYDIEKLGKAFDEFTKAATENRVRYMVMLQELAPYLQVAIEDTQLTSNEADSLVILFEKAVKK